MKSVCASYALEKCFYTKNGIVITEGYTTSRSSMMHKEMSPHTQTMEENSSLNTL